MGEPSVAFLGDSFTSGSAMGGLEGDGWPALSCKRLGCRPLPYGVSGSGFAEGGPPNNPFTARVESIIAEAPEVVVIAGGHNDRDARAATTAAQQVVQQLQTGLPDSELVMIGPIEPNDAPTEEQRTLDTNLRQIADDAGIPYESPIAQGWFSGEFAGLIGSDGLHPTDAGHRHIRDLMVPILERDTQAF